MAEVTQQSTTISNTVVTSGSLRDLLTEVLMYLPMYEREIAYVTLSTIKALSTRPDEDGWKFTIGWKPVSDE